MVRWNSRAPGRSYTPAQTVISLAALTGLMWIFMMVLTGGAVWVATLVAVIGFVLGGSFLMWVELYLERDRS